MNQIFVLNKPNQIHLEVNSRIGQNQRDFG